MSTKLRIPRSGRNAVYFLSREKTLYCKRFISGSDISDNGNLISTEERPGGTSTDCLSKPRFSLPEPSHCNSTLASRDCGELFLKARETVVFPSTRWARVDGSSTETCASTPAPPPRAHTNRRNFIKAPLCRPVYLRRNRSTNCPNASDKLRPRLST